MNCLAEEILHTNGEAFGQGRGVNCLCSPFLCNMVYVIR